MKSILKQVCLIKLINSSGSFLYTIWNEFIVIKSFFCGFKSDIRKFTNQCSYLFCLVFAVFCKWDLANKITQEITKRLIFVS